MKIFSIIFVLLFSVNLQAPGKKFKIQELGFSFEEPDWNSNKNESFNGILKKYGWNVENAIKSVSTGSLEMVRYHLNNDKRVFIDVSVSGLHKELRSFDKLMQFQKEIKVDLPNFKILQPLTQINISGKKALISSVTYKEKDGKGNSYMLISKSLRVFMGSFIYNVYIQTKDTKDIEVFDDIVKTIAITK